MRTQRRRNAAPILDPDRGCGQGSGVAHDRQAAGERGPAGRAPAARRPTGAAAARGQGAVATRPHRAAPGGPLRFRQGTHRHGDSDRRRIDQLGARRRLQLPGPPDRWAASLVRLEGVEAEVPCGTPTGEIDSSKSIPGTSASRRPRRSPTCSVIAFASAHSVGPETATPAPCARRLPTARTRAAQPSAPTARRQHRGTERFEREVSVRIVRPCRYSTRARTALGRSARRGGVRPLLLHRDEVTVGPRHPDAHVANSTSRATRHWRSATGPRAPGPARDPLLRAACASPSGS